MLVQLIGNHSRSAPRSVLGTTSQHSPERARAGSGPPERPRQHSPGNVCPTGSRNTCSERAPEGVAERGAGGCSARWSRTTSRARPGARRRPTSFFIVTSLIVDISACNQGRCQTVMHLRSYPPPGTPAWRRRRPRSITYPRTRARAQSACHRQGWGRTAAAWPGEVARRVRVRARRDGGGGAPGTGWPAAGRRRARPSRQPQRTASRQPQGNAASPPAAATPRSRCYSEAGDGAGLP
jgi:hypothetical protein